MVDVVRDSSGDYIHPVLCMNKKLLFLVPKVFKILSTLHIKVCRVNV